MNLKEKKNRWNCDKKNKSRVSRSGRLYLLNYCHLNVVSVETMSVKVVDQFKNVFQTQVAFVLTFYHLRA